MQYLIKEIIRAKPYILTLKFNTGEILDVDLEPKLIEWTSTPDSIYKQLLEKDYFCQVQFEQDWETIFWDNGVDLCADVLYELAAKTKPSQIKNEIVDAIFILYKTLDKEQRKTVIQKMENDLLLADK
jgi:glycogen debranching enzyme